MWMVLTGAPGITMKSLAAWCQSMSSRSLRQGVVTPPQAVEGYERDAPKRLRVEPGPARRRLHRPVRPDTVVVVYFAFVGAIAPRRFSADVVRWRAFQLLLVEINNVTAEVRVVL